MFSEANQIQAQASKIRGLDHNHTTLVELATKFKSNLPAATVRIFSFCFSAIKSDWKIYYPALEFNSFLQFKYNLL